MYNVVGVQPAKSSSDVRTDFESSCEALDVVQTVLQIAATQVLSHDHNLIERIQARTHQHHYIRVFQSSMCTLVQQYINQKCPRLTSSIAALRVLIRHRALAALF